MKSYVIFFISICSFYLPLKAQLNVALLHQLVEHSKQESDRQHNLRNTQSITSANQHVNQQQTSSLKNTYRTITQRFQVLGAALQTINTSIESAELVNNIIDQHSRIIRQIEKDPSNILLAVQAEIEFIGRTRLLARYILGILLSYGEINQMKQSDRRILYAHVITELKNLLSLSRNLASAMHYSSLFNNLKSRNPFADYINTDKRIVDQILSRLKSIKQ